ncbi:amino acid adenylation domain-containing protein [Micromonospora sp. NBC_00362]|uniref:non-ribosomal peptide synthetase n=1 Tax=Micromonospora sp. NBC_00362 TaxID=2975975 RepID=UPI0022570E81|nr:non-ribosomal peptide synthetase [Micromonospora sp. NBC_00362]MCX5118699.1 amino acid adenylation domain-containing protein [Micromonospora sp. NBC_00362]
MTTDASASRPAPHGAGLSPGRSRLDSMSPSKRALFEKRLAGRRPRPAEALARVPRGGDLPVSPAQRRLWFMDQLVPGSAMFNVPTALRLTGALRLDVLTDAVRALVDRHEALRTVFAANEGDPVQRILRDIEVDLTPRPLPVDDAAVLAAVRDEASRPFSLSVGPLARAALFRQTPTAHVLVLTLHHSICDGWSVSLLIDELLELYRAGAEDRAPRLAPLTVQYADYAAWESHPDRAAELAEGLDYWKRALAGAVPVIDLPLDRPRPPVQSFRGERHRFALPDGLWQAVTRLAQDERATPFMVLLAGFAALMSRYAAQDEVSVVTPVANRPRVELETMVGSFVNSIVVRVDTSGAPTFRALVGRVRDLVQQGMAHGEVPFDTVVEAVDPERDLSHTPLAQVMFALVEDQALEAEAAGLRVTAVEHHLPISKHDLTVEVWPDADGRLRGVAEYATDILDERTVARMAAHLGVLLVGLTAAPDAPVGLARLLSDEETRAAVVDGNRTEDPLLGDVRAHELFARQAARTPDAPALLVGDLTVTFGELDRRADALAARLRRHGVGPETRVGLFLDRGVDLVTAVLATLRAGGVYVPLDVGEPAERVRFMLTDAEVRVVVTSAGRVADLPDTDVSVLLPDGDEDATTDLPPLPRPHPDSACYVIYTSGSTGRPKGVVVTHRGLTNYLAWSMRAYRVAEGGGAPLVSPLRFDLSVTTLFCPLLAGRPVVLVADGTELETLTELLGSDLDLGLVKLTPAHLEALDRAVPSRTIAADGYLIVGGESLHGATAAAWRRRAPGLRIVNEYGPTETVVGCCVHEVHDGTDLSGVVPIGRPIANTRLYVLDGNLLPVPPGTVGELYVAGAGVARGYHGRPDLTAGRFLPDPFAPTPGERMYRTGDLVRVRPDGELDCLGRIDTQVKIRGYRVELAEIEATLTRLPQVREAVVLLRTDRPGEERLVAYVTAAGDSMADDPRDALRAELPDYMVPEVVVPLDALPLAANGKVDRAALPAPTAAEPAPTLAAPESRLEEAIAEVWADVLGRPVESIGRDANFLDLGGHSLLAVRAMARLRKKLEIELPLAVFLESTSLADLGTRIEALGGRAPRPGLVAVPRTGPVPLSHAQGRLYFLNRLAEDSAFYNVPLALRFDGDLRADALRVAFGALWARHEGLRTRFPSVDGEPVQEFLPVDAVAYAEVDVQGDADPEGRLAALFDAEGRTPFDLAAGPLLRGTLVRVRPDSHVLLLTLHHTVSDGWSLNIVLNDLVTLYREIAQGQPSSLPELTHTYVDYTFWQRSWLIGAELDDQLDWWKRQLDGVPTLDLPTDRPRPAVQTFRGARHDISWSAERSRAVADLARREKVSLFMALLAGFDVLMAQLSGQRDITVGTPVANRTSTELEKLVGFFANTLALRVDLSGDPTFREVLRRVRSTAHGAYAHQDVPFEMVVDAVAPTRSLSHSPLFQVRFALQNAPGGLPDPGPGLTLTSIDNEQCTARFDLLIDLWENGDGIEGHAEYSTDLFDAGTVEAMMSRLGVLMDRLVGDPDQRVFDVDPLLPGERERLDALAHGPALPVGAAHRTLTARVGEQARRRPDAPAVTSGETTLSYGDLHRRSGDLARVLAERGAGPGTTIALHLDRGVDVVVAALAVLETGAAYVPLDPAYPAQRLAAIVADARPTMTLTTRDLAGRTPQGAGEVVTIEDLPAPVGPRPTPALRPEHPAYVVYTSGTKGLPKGVVVTHGGLSAYLEGLPAALALPDEPVFLHTASFAFSSSVRQFAVPLALGGHVVVAGRAHLADPLALLTFVTAHGVQVLDLVPSYLRVLLPALTSPGGWRPQVVLTASEPLRYELPEAIRNAPGTAPRLVNMYGQTETTGIVAVAEVRIDRAGREAVVPLGRPIPGARLYVLDERLRPVPTGLPGEIVVGGAGLARGYLGDAALTAERFVPDPLGAPGDRLYRTGDRGRLLPDGTVEFLGRIGDQVKIRGHRVEPDEVASALSALDGVGECVVLCDDDGADDRRLMAHVALRPGTALSTDDLRAALRERLPDYMVPTVALVDRLPRLPNGKVDRATLSAPTPTVAPATAAATATAETRRGPVEGILTGIWRDVLRVPSVGPEDNFFALGGDSLHVIRVVDRARKAGVVITPAQFIAHPTIAALASVATDAQTPADKAREVLAGIWREVLRVPSVGPEDNFFALGGDSLHVIRVVDRARKAGVVITPAQFIAHPTIAGLASVAGGSTTAGAGGDESRRTHPGGVPLVASHVAFAERNFADPHKYTHIFMFEAMRSLDPALLERAVAAVITHHDSLRISFPRAGGRLSVRVNEAYQPTPFTSVDLSALDPADQEVAFRRLDRTLHRKLDIENGPLLQVALVRFGADRPELLVVIVHHQLMDNSSWDVLMADLQTAYQAVEAGEEPRLPLSTASFAEWSRNLDALARGTELTEDIAYWTALAKEPVPTWPLDHPDGDDCMSSEETVVVGLDAEETAALRRLVPQEYGLSVNDALLAATLQGFTDWSGQSSILVDLVARGREMGGQDLDLSRAIGRFSMTSPRLVRRPEKPGPRALLESVREQIEAVPRRGLAFGLLRYLGGHPDVADALAPLGKPDILLNNWGEFAHEPEESPLLGPAMDDFWPMPKLQRMHRLQVFARFADGELSLHLKYSSNLNERKSIERLAALTLAALRSFVRPDAD